MGTGRLDKDEALLCSGFIMREKVVITSQE
jgi:hypothetical protein